jgi:hypothetical protein
MPLKGSEIQTLSEAWAVLNPAFKALKKIVFGGFTRI